MLLRHKFFLATSLLTSIPLLVLLFVVVERAEQEVKAGLENRLQSALEKMGSELDILLNHQTSMARGLASVPAVKRFAASSVAENRVGYQFAAESLENFFLNYQHAVPSIQALRFMAPTGHTLVKIKEGQAIRAQRREQDMKWLFVADQSNKRFFKQAMKSKRDVTLSDFELGRVTVDADFCPAMVRYSVKVYDELDALEGILVVNIWGTQVDARVEASLGGYPGKPYIVELNDNDSARDGIYLYHPDNSYRFANQVGSQHRLSNELSTEEWAYLRDKPAGSIFRNDGRMLFFKHFTPDNEKESRWALIIETTSETVLAPINNMRRSIWYMLAVVLFLGLVAATWWAMRLARPINQLATTIKRYANGDHSVRYEGQSGDEIGTAGRAFNYLTESLEQAERERDEAEKAVRQSERLAAVGQMAAGIGHEINNPLMNIMSLAALLEKELEGKDEQMHSDIKLLMTEGRRCARIVQGILNFAREGTPSYQAFDMTKLLHDTVDLLRHRLEVEKLQVEVQIADALTMVGDPNLLQQVFVNVLLNAIQAVPGGSVIQIKARQDGENIFVEILDNGPGINDANLSQVLDPFFTTKPEGDGTGLGLSVSYGIVKEHGGEIRLENRAEGGVRVLVQLPIDADAQRDLERDLKQELEQEQPRVEVANAN